MKTLICLVLLGLIQFPAFAASKKRVPSSSEAIDAPTSYVGIGPLLLKPRELAASPTSAGKAFSLFKFKAVNATGVFSKTRGVISGFLESGEFTDLIVSQECAQIAATALANRSRKFVIGGVFAKSGDSDWKELVGPNSEYCVLLGSE